MGKLNIVDKPEIPFSFGKYNRRPLNLSQARRLAASIDSEGVRSYAPENMLPVFVFSADCIEVEGLIKDISGTQNMTEIRFTGKVNKIKF
jgi:hypothetical protein